MRKDMLASSYVIFVIETSNMQHREVTTDDIFSIGKFSI